MLLFKKGINVMIAIFIVVFLIIEYYCIYVLQLPANDFVSKILTYYRHDTVALGCFLGVLHFNKNKLIQGVKGIHFVLSIAIMILLLGGITLNSYGYFSFAICFAVIIAYLVNSAEKFTCPKWLVFIGTISYSINLTHEIVIVFLLKLNLDRFSPLLMYITSFIGAVLLASLLYYVVEKTFIKIGKLVSVLSANTVAEKYK